MSPALIQPILRSSSEDARAMRAGSSVVTGNANRFTVGAGVTLTLKNITFKTIPFTVAAGGKLVLDNGAVVTENAGMGITVTGEATEAKGTLEMRAGSFLLRKTTIRASV